MGRGNILFLSLAFHSIEALLLASLKNCFLNEAVRPGDLWGISSKLKVLVVFWEGYMP